ncbi:MAG: calcium/sodium antiporter [Burkholderiales bacterium]|nr:MAG: calcium/sodium antiporter [Burkholderiales bacterium]
MTLVWFAAGLVALVVGAELLVRGASRLAVSLGLSPLVVGLTIVALGTSAPEIAVSVGAVISGTTDVAVGNVIGSNIFNVLLVLGASALVTPLAVDSQLIRQEVPIMIGCSLLLAVLVLDGELGRTDAALLTLLMVAYLAFLVWQSRVRTRRRAGRNEADAPAAGHDDAITRAAHRGWDGHWTVQVGLVAVGLIGLVLGAQLLVEAAVAFARALGVSDLVIGLTVVAAGTSLPEVAASLMAAWRGDRDIAVGNVVGSCILNILACLGIAGLVSEAPLSIAQAVLNFDLWVMVAVAAACLPVLLTGREIARWEGAIFVGYYAAYTAYLILAAQQHDALAAYSNAMLSFVVPLTIVTLIAMTIRHPARRSRTP